MYYNKNSCLHKNSHETKGFFLQTCLCSLLCERRQIFCTFTNGLQEIKVKKRSSCGHAIQMACPTISCFYSHCTNANHFNVCQKLTKVQCKQLFNKALAFQARVNHRSYAQVVTQPQGTGFTDKHYQSSHDSRSVGSSTQNTIAAHSKVVSTKGHIKGHDSYKRTNVTCQESSFLKHNATVGAYKHLEQLGQPTSHIAKHRV